MASGKWSETVFHDDTKRGSICLSILTVGKVDPLTNGRYRGQYTHFGDIHFTLCPLATMEEFDTYEVAKKWVSKNLRRELREFIKLV